MVYVVVALLVVAFWIFCVLEALLADRFRVRTLPKWAWVLTTIAVPVAGGLLWFAMGRPRASDDRGGGNGGNGGGGVRGPAVPPRGPIAPDDDPEFLQRLRWEAERERRRRERDASKDGPGAPGAGAGGGSASEG